MYCTYCNTLHDDKESSVEHVIPFAIGGSNSLTILTCRGKNNDLGSDVDAPFIDFFSIRHRRFFLGLKSTSGKEPTLDLGGMGWIDGKETPISYRVDGDVKELKIASPNIVKLPNPNGGEYWSISGDPVKVREILLGKLRSEAKKGKSLTLGDGSILREENLDALVEQLQIIIENPSVSKTISYDSLMPVRFFSKLALAMGHFHFGEAFSRSAYAEVLRRHMRIERLEDFALPGTAIWPETSDIQPMLDVLGKNEHHTVAILAGTPPVLLVSLFGDIGALIPLGAIPEESLPELTNARTVWRIELPSRQLTMMTMDDLYREHALAMQARTLASLKPADTPAETEL